MEKIKQILFYYKKFWKIILVILIFLNLILLNDGIIVTERFISCNITLLFCISMVFYRETTLNKQ